MKKKKKILFKIKEIKTIFKEQTIELLSDVPTVLFGLNGVGKTSILSGINFIVSPNTKHNTTYLRQKKSYENENIKNQDEIIGRTMMHSPLQDSDLERIDYLLKEIGFKKFSFVQTIFHKLDEIKTKEEIKDGYGEGSFVVIGAMK